MYGQELRGIVKKFEKSKKSVVKVDTSISFCAKMVRAPLLQVKCSLQFICTIEGEQ